MDLSDLFETMQRRSVSGEDFHFSVLILLGWRDIQEENIPCRGSDPRRNGCRGQFPGQHKEVAEVKVFEFLQIRKVYISLLAHMGTGVWPDFLPNL